MRIRVGLGLIRSIIKRGHVPLTPQLSLLILILIWALGLGPLGSIADDEAGIVNSEAGTGMLAEDAISKGEGSSEVFIALSSGARHSGVPSITTTSCFTIVDAPPLSSPVIEEPPSLSDAVLSDPPNAKTLAVIPYCLVNAARADTPKIKPPSLLAKGFLDRGNSFGKQSKKKKQSMPYSPPKTDEADNVVLISTVDKATTDKLKKKKGKEISTGNVSLEDPLTIDSVLDIQKSLSGNQLSAIQAYAAKHPVKRSAWLIGDFG